MLGRTLLASTVCAALASVSQAEVTQLDVVVTGVRTADEDEVAVLLWCPMKGRADYMDSIPVEPLAASEARDGKVSFRVREGLTEIEEQNRFGWCFLQAVTTRQGVPVRASRLEVEPLYDAWENGNDRFEVALEDSVNEALEATFSTPPMLLGERFEDAPALVVMAIRVLFDEGLLTDKQGYAALLQFVDAHKAQIRDLGQANRDALFAYLAGRFSAWKQSPDSLPDYADFYVTFYNALISTGNEDGTPDPDEPPNFVVVNNALLDAMAQAYAEYPLDLRGDMETTVKALRAHRNYNGCIRLSTTFIEAVNEVNPPGVRALATVDPQLTIELLDIAREGVSCVKQVAAENAAQVPFEQLDADGSGTLSSAELYFSSQKLTEFNLALSTFVDSSGVTYDWEKRTQGEHREVVWYSDLVKSFLES